MDQAVIEEEEVSLRDEIASAIDTYEPTDSPLQSKNAPAEEVSPAAPAATPAVPAVKPEDKPAVAAPVAAPGDKGKLAGAPTELKAPSSWKPQVREKWNAIPREVQEEIHRRESDNLRLIGSVGQKIKLDRKSVV